MNPKPETLWLALQFPHLALDLVTRGHEHCSELPIAISDNDARKQAILDCNPAAMSAGVRPGLAVNAALGLLEDLQLLPRDEQAEQDALERLAGWCYQYSSLVTIVPRHAILMLEIGGSQRLFGPSEELSSKLTDELLKLGYHLRAGTAPTPGAARLAARHGLYIGHTSEIQQQIKELPLDSLEPERIQAPALKKMGFRSVGEILKLPRKALARRMGPAAVDYLDRLTGSRPDPQLPWQPPEHFSSGMDLASEVSSSQALLFPLKRLVSELCGVLRARDRGIQELIICLRLDSRKHEQDEERLRLGLAQPTRDDNHILLLLHERLERLRLTHPVLHVRLEAGRLLPFDAQQDSLFRDNPDLAAQPVAPLLERLRARLGSDAVSGLRGRQDHRPEYSWSVRELDEPADCTAMPHRPIWLFATPQRCHIAEYQVLAGPERIEAGWWDGHDCRRDYFVVRDRTGCTLWAFREYKPEPGWYLQGMFA